MFGAATMKQDLCAGLHSLDWTVRANGALLCIARRWIVAALPPRRLG
jgi:hypothetical protein